MKIRGKRIAATFLALMFACTVLSVTAFATEDPGTESSTPESPSSTDVVVVTSIIINSSTGQNVMHVGESMTLTASIDPKNATNPNLVWNSSDPSVVSVSGGDFSATVTSNSAGTAKIGVAAQDGGGAYGQFIITVLDNSPSQASRPSENPNPDPIIDVESILIDSQSNLNRVRVGTNVVLTARVSPSNATNKEVTWSTSNPSVARVDGGVVYTKSPGSATITARAGNKSAAVVITVVSGSGTDASSDDTTTSRRPNDSGAGTNSLASTDSNNDPSALSSQDWAAILGSSGSNSSGSSSSGSSSAGGTVSTPEDTSGGGGSTWILVLGIALISLAVVGVGAFVFLQFIQPKYAAARLGSDEEDDFDAEEYTDIKSETVSPPKPAKTPPVRDRSKFTTAEIDIPLDVRETPKKTPPSKKIPSPEDRDSFDWDKFFDDNTPTGGDSRR